MAYENDPREWQIRPESGVTLEEDNRKEQMWHWGAHILDLCDLPVEEYMKPMEVRGVGGGGEGGGGDDTGTTPTVKDVKFTVKVISPDGDVIDANGNVVETVENPDNEWKVSIIRDKNFASMVDVEVEVVDTDDNTTSKTIEINGVSSNKTTDASLGLSNDTQLKSVDATFDDGKQTKEVEDDEGNVIANITINIPKQKTDDEMNLYYWFGVHKVGYKDSELISFTSTDADESDGGFDFDVIEPKSDLIIAENAKFQNGESPYDDDDTAQDIFDEFLANMQAASAYSLSVFVPTEILETKELVVSSYNDLGETISSDIENTVTVEGVEYKQYTFYVGPDGYRYKLTADNQQFRFNAKIR
jgi:hypothetical protein